MQTKKYLTAAFIILLCPLIGFSQGNDTITYSILLSGNIKGFDKTWKNADGSFGEWYQYNDRGRGDSILTIYREDEEGFPTFIAARGKDYMKNEVIEDFSLSDGVARWKNKAENEERTLATKLFYAGLNSNGGHLIKALKAHNKGLQMLPFGELTLQVLQEHSVGTGDSVKKLLLVSVSGTGMTPEYSWIDQKDETFASLSPWFCVIQRGYEQYIPELLAIQKKIESAFFGKLARELPETIKGSILIKNVNLYDAENARIIPNTDVLIIDGIIRQISPGKRINYSASRSINGKGKTLLPGLWDMHVHFSGELDGILHIAAGVTHVRDMGNDSTLLTRIKQIKKGTLIGPKVEIMSGFIDGAGPFAAPTGVLINNLEEGIKAIHQYAGKGYQQIKLYSSIKPEWVKPLIEEAHRLHLRVCGHIPAFMTATQAIEAGYNEVTHMNMLVLNFYGDTVDTRSPLRFSLPAQKAAFLDLKGKEMSEFIGLLKTRHITVDPTLSAFESMFTNRDGQVPISYKDIVYRFPIAMQRNLRAGGGGVPVVKGMEETYMRSFETFLQITKMLYDNGIRIVPGTDGFAGFDLERELELYVKAGIPPAKVLQLATWGTATYTGKSNKSGSIKTGKEADLVLVEGNPVENISDIRKTALVIRANIMYDPAKLYNAISIKPYR